jgi:hypothetical protein
MPDNNRTLRAHDLIGQRVRDHAGNHLGRIVDLILDSNARPPARVVEVIVTDGPWGRLLGYESPDDKGPWILSALARWIIHRHIRTLPWHDIVLDTGTNTDA